MSEQECLLVSSGDGPGECRQAVGHLLVWLTEEAARFGLDIDIAEREAQHGPSSAVVVLNGIGAGNMARDVEGVVLWRCQSALRQKHPRKNWFVHSMMNPFICNSSGHGLNWLGHIVVLVRETRRK